MRRSLPLLATWPVFRAMGLDEHKNSKDEVKAMRAYGSMTKEDFDKACGTTRGKIP